MSEVAQFPIRSFVEIDAGTVTKSDDAARIGRFFYFVNVVQMGEGSLGVWDGESHSDAVREANAMAADLSLPVVDNSQGRRQ
ncbi:MAG TPA: hypothetical protein VGO06_28545 [Bosea sp. (in: a-proteobacteria)]|jgi:hypothetical protein|uniref:hypothetical protein n=1 Tax=Bosea sp. (in: a-proteobacteria) TaxID=1871050 RepID=UPI002E100DE2|nr:hypothetical protein [Bosea sp. (in: a-proteobacteria)]